MGIGGRRHASAFLHPGMTQYSCCIGQCFSTAGPRPGSGPWYQLYRAARGSHEICYFSFL